MENLLYYIFASLTLVFSILVIGVRNPIHSVLFLMVVFCNVTVLLVLLQSEFMAFIFLMVYVGAIAVLFLFVVMMLNIRLIEWNQYLFRFLPLGSFLGVLLLVQILSIINEDFLDKPKLQDPQYTSWLDVLYSKTNIEVLGDLLYTEHAFSLIVASLVLLVAMIGAIVLTMYRRANLKRQSINLQTRRLWVEGIRLHSN